jgi:MoxR-like ATPase
VQNASSHTSPKTVKDWNNLVDGIMDGRYTVGKDGKVNMNQSSVIVNDEALEQGATFDDESVHARGKEVPGSVKQIIDAQGRNVVVRKQQNGRWAPVDSPADEWNSLDTDTKKGYNKIMEQRVDTSLIPHADRYLDAGFNVMLIGLHGTGKTASIKALADARGIKMKYYSCSTLDPFTDLVGVPSPVYYCPDCDDKFETKIEHKELHPDCKGKLDRQLDMVRPREVDEAELLFFDEFNRADPKVQNAVFEIIQFGSINGEKLPNLKACWAAINPPDDEQNYQVEQLDPALLDRFDLYIDITAKPSVQYMQKFMPEPVARALKLWWDEHQNAIRLKTKDAHSDYLSPRRLEKIGLVWCATQNSKAVFASLPMGGNFEKKKLIDHLKAAQAEVNAANGGALDPDIIPDDIDMSGLDGAGLGDRPNPRFTYRPANMKLDAKELSEYLRDNPGHEATHNKVVEVLKSGTGGEELVMKFGKIIDALNPAKLEGMVAGFPPPKVGHMRQGFMKLYKDNPTEAKKLDSLHKVLGRGAATPVGWPKTL